MAVEVEGRTLYTIRDTEEPNAPGSALWFETESAAVASWLRSHPWTPEEAGPLACVVCDGDTVDAVAFAGRSHVVFASLVRMGVAEETAHTIMEADARLKGHAWGLEESPFNTTVGVPVCRRCADKAGLEVGPIGEKVPTFSVTDAST
jgi:hypothetical protein